MSIRDGTNNKSQGAIFHANLEEVSLTDETNNKLPGAIYYVSPEGFYMDVDGRATHMYRAYGQIIAPAISALPPSVVVVLG